MGKPINTIHLLLDKANLVNVLMISGAYLGGHYFWYISIKNSDLSISSAIQAPQPILTTTLATLILGESLAIYDLVGIILIVSSIFIIIYNKNKRRTR